MSVNEQFSAALESSVNRRGGIMELIKSELKARDVAARKQLNSLMQGQPDPNSILAQNERAVENDVRQQVGQRLQSMAVKERQNQARMQRAMSGIANQAPRMNFAASGGIVGYRDGGPAQEEAGMLDKVKAGIAGLFGGEEKEQPAPFDVEARVIELLRLRKTADEEAKARIDQALSTFDSATRAAAQMRMDEEGMQSGGIVGFDNGGLMPQVGIFGPAIPGAVTDFGMFLANKGYESLEGLSTATVNRLRQEYEAAKARELNRPRGDSVSESQMENLSGVLKGAGNLLLEGITPSSPPSAGEREAMEAQRESRRSGPGAILQGVASLAPEGKSDLQKELEAAERRMINEDILRRNTESRRAERAKFRNADAGVQDTEEAREEARRSFEEIQAAFAGTPTSDDEAGLTPREAARRRFEKTQAAFEGVPTTDESPLTAEEVASINENIARGDSLGQELIRRMKADPVNALSTAMMLIPVGGWAGGLGIKAVSKLIPYMVKHPMLASFVAGATMKLPAPDVEKALTSIGLGEDLEEVKDTILTELVGPDPLDELRAPEQSDEEIAEEIIRTAPETTTAASTEDVDAADTKDVPQIANPSLRAAIEATQEGAQDAPPAQESEASASELANTVVQNPTPENTSRFESEIQRLMERRESPVRALSTFLTAFSQARGGSLGQKLGVASTALRATDDALDKQIVELEKLRRADQISERDFGLKERQLKAQKGLLEAQASYYENYKDMQEEVARIRQESGVFQAQSSVFASVSNLVRDNLSLYRLQAQAELGARDLLAPEVLDKANELMRNDIRNQFRQALSYFNLPATTAEQVGGGAGSNSPVVQNALDVIGQ